MAKEYYVFQTKEESDSCINYINSTPWFPVTGIRNGTPDPAAAQTTCWCTDPREMISGEWAVPRIPENRLDYIGVPQEDRDAFLSVFGQDIRELNRDDFPIIEEDI